VARPLQNLVKIYPAEFAQCWEIHRYVQSVVNIFDTLKVITDQPAILEPYKKSFKDAKYTN